MQKTPPKTIFQTFKINVAHILPSIRAINNNQTMTKKTFVKQKRKEKELNPSLKWPLIQIAVA